MDTMAAARQWAGVTDPTWSPPEDVMGPAHGPDLDALARIPAMSKESRADGEIGTRWRLTARASIVVPRGYVMPSLALLAVGTRMDRYTLEADTTFRLVEVYHADADPLAVDQATYASFFEGWSSWRLQIEDGPSRGIMVGLPSDLGPASRYPVAVQRAALAVVPA